MFGWIGAIVGILLLLFAAFMVFFFPSPVAHQPESFGWNGVLIGFIAGIVGVALLFL